MAGKKTVEMLVRVRGRSPFPIDMLRFDRGFPYSEIDSAKIADSWTNYGEVREVDVRLTGHGAPAAGRWESFGWAVSHVWDGAQWVPYQPEVHRVWK